MKSGLDSHAWRPNAKRSPGRPDDKSQELCATFRHWISSGKYGPGDKFPTQRQLSAEFGVSPVTILQTFHELAADGFIRTARKLGTFVVDSPPHLHNIGIIFPSGIESNILWRVFAEVAGKKRQDDIKLSCWFKMDGHTDSQEYIKLADEIYRQKFLGLFFTSAPFLVKDTPLMTLPDVPRCFFGYDNSYPELANLTVDSKVFRDKALAWLKEQGRHKIAVIGHSKIASDDWEKSIHEFGLETRPYWIQGVSVVAPSPARNLARLMFHTSQSEVPDGLIITDDNLVEQSTIGLADSEINIPEDLNVVAHANFPRPPVSAVPVRRLGYDFGRILDQAVKICKDMRSGQKPTKHAEPAYFEEELVGRARD